MSEQTSNTLNGEKEDNDEETSSNYADYGRTNTLSWEVLEQAFSNDPLNIYTAPDPETRRRIFFWFFTHLYVKELLHIRYIQLLTSQKV